MVYEASVAHIAYNSTVTDPVNWFVPVLLFQEARQSWRHGTAGLQTYPIPAPPCGQVSSGTPPFLPPDGDVPFIYYTLNNTIIYKSY